MYETKLGANEGHLKTARRPIYNCGTKLITHSLKCTSNPALFRPQDRQIDFLVPRSLYQLSDPKGKGNNYSKMYFYIANRIFCTKNLQTNVALHLE